MGMNLPLTYILTFVVAFCSITYELLLAQTLATVLGNTVLRYSLTIGFYLAAMGIGAMLCDLKKDDKPLPRLFRVEVGLTIAGGISVIYIHYLDIIQKYLFAYSPFMSSHLFNGITPVDILFFIFSQGIIILIGIYSGYEIPLLIQIGNESGKNVTNRVLGVDYFGSLAGSVLFPLILLPRLGIFAIAFLVALLNALASLVVATAGFKNKKIPAMMVAFLIFLLGTGLFATDSIQQYFLKKFYFYRDISTIGDIFSPSSTHRNRIEHRDSPYQGIDLVTDTLTSEEMEQYRRYSNRLNEHPGYPDDKWLFLNGSYQFYSLTDDLYHEYIVHIPIHLQEEVPRRVLILGGGDGLIARELLKYDDVELITQIELDGEVLRLAQNHPVLKVMNGGSLKDPRVEALTGDAFYFLRHNREKYDAIFLDFPAPLDYSLSILYSREFYSLVRHALTEKGFAIMDMPGGDVNNTSSLFPVYYNTVHAAGFQTVFPISTNLEILSSEDFNFFELEKSSELSDRLMQAFLYMRPGKLHNPGFHDHGIDFHILNEERFYRAFISFDDTLRKKLINSIYKPTVPEFTLFGMYFPY